jgi:hypothetical protein
MANRPSLTAAGIYDTTDPSNEAEAQQERHRAEIEDLQALIDQPGWLALRAYAEQRYGAAAFAQRVQEAAKSSDAVEVGRIAQLLTLSQREVLDVLTWPEVRLRQLRQALKVS